MKMSKPSLHTEVYEAIAPEKLKGKNQNKVAVVTGAARGSIFIISYWITFPNMSVGIGQAIAEALAKTGANLAILDFDVERQAETVEQCQSHGVKVVPYACDITNEEAIESVFSQIKSEFGSVEYDLFLL